MPKKNNYPVFWEHSFSGSVINGMNEKSLPPLEILNWLFRYDSLTGKLYRIRNADGKVCSPEREVILKGGSGYLQVNITDSSGLKKKFQSHRIIYYMQTGVPPTDSLDHINGDKLDNRIENLRVVSNTVNNRNKAMQSNNTSGHTGVCWDSQAQKWVSRIYINGKKKHLGLFFTIEEAVATRSAFIRQFNIDNPDSAYTERHGS